MVEIIHVAKIGKGAKGDEETESDPSPFFHWEVLGFFSHLLTSLLFLATDIDRSTDSHSPYGSSGSFLGSMTGV